MCSGCLTVIIVQHPAQPLSAPDGPTRFNLGLARNDQPVPPSLVVPFQVIMRNEFMNGLTQRALIPSGLGSRLLSTDIRLKSKRRFRLRFKASFPEADGEREEVNRPLVRQERVGGSGATMAGPGNRTATEWVDQDAARGGVAATAAAGRGRGRGRAKKTKRKAGQQLLLDLPEATHLGVRYEYAVLVTSMQDEVRTIAQHYRDRGDAENNFDELKNQWAWSGFTTHDRKRCQIMARITALVYNWWTIFMRLGIPEKHAEAITSRPLALHGIARQTRHGNQTTVEITSTHAKSSQIAEILTKVSGFLKRIKATAEQLTQGERWKLILSAAFRQFLGGKVIGSTGRLADATS